VSNPLLFDIGLPLKHVTSQIELLITTYFHWTCRFYFLVMNFVNVKMNWRHPLLYHTQISTHPITISTLSITLVFLINTLREKLKLLHKRADLIVIKGTIVVHMAFEFTF